VPRPPDCRRCGSKRVRVGLRSQHQRSRQRRPRPAVGREDLVLESQFN
jgi:hypothetical protein